MGKASGTRRRIYIEALGLALALPACVHAPGPPNPSDLMSANGNIQAAERAVSEGAKYVALGSSFAAGAGIGPRKAGTPVRCSRTTNNYPSLVAARLDLVLDDQSCGGARTADILERWNELPAQVDALNDKTRLVTVTIGGNDLDYVGNLFMASCMTRQPSEVVSNDRPCRPPRAPDDETYSELEQRLHEVAAQVRARAPKAILIFVQYVTLVPQELCEATAMAEEHAALNRQIGLRLAEITARAAAEMKAIVLSADELSRNHTPCDAVPWATGFPPDHDPSRGAPWHPNAAGHEAIADALVDILGQNGSR